MYMHKNKKIIICKFNLKNKCKFGEECKFKHLNLNEMNKILIEFEDLKQKYESLKRNLKEKCQNLSNLEKKDCDVTNESPHTLSKPLYNSFFKENMATDDLRNKSKSKLVKNGSTTPKKRSKHIGFYSMKIANLKYLISMQNGLELFKVKTTYLLF
jgi:hypothetical protein